MFLVIVGGVGGWLGFPVLDVWCCALGYGVLVVDSCLHGMYSWYGLIVFKFAL